MYPVEDCTCTKDCDKCKTVIGTASPLVETTWRTGGIVMVYSTFSSLQSSSNGYIAVYVTFKVCGMNINAMFGFTGIPLYHEFDFENKNKKFRGFRVMIQNNVFYPNHNDYLFGFSYLVLDKDFDSNKNIIYQVIYVDNFPQKTHEESILKCGNGTCDAGETISNCPIDCNNDICPQGAQMYCGLGFYLQENICQKCANGCSNCTFRVNCSKCFKGYFLQYSQCVQKCSKGNYGDKQLKMCKQCDKACESCHDNGQYNCIKCVQGYSIRKIDGLELCKRSCNNNCKTCNEKEPNYCLSCFENDFLYQGICQKSCPGYYYQNSKEQLCSKCLDFCINCMDNKKCQECAQDYFLDENKKCVTKCEQFYFEDVANNKCSQCIKNCKKCQNQFKCENCMTSFQIIKDICVHDCQFGQYRSKEGTCLPCDTKCTSCLNEINENCSKCQDGFYLNPQRYDCEECFGTCQKECKMSSYLDKFKKVCQKCHETCLSCDGPYETDCLSCYTKNLIYLQNKQCKKECIREKYFTNKKLNICETCKINACLECLEGADLCNKCEENNYLIEDKKQCSNNCPIAYQQIEDKCKKCINEYCIYCSVDLKTCLQCENDKVLYDFKCYIPCQISQYRDEQTKSCRPCLQECKTCVSYSNKDCLSCNSEYVFNPVKKLNEQLIGNCIQECPKMQFYYDTLLEMCQKCNESCQTCKGSGEYECDTCIQEYYKAQDGRCFKYCPSNLFYQNKQKSICEKCKVEGCMNCQEGADMCLLCKGNYFTQIENNRKVCKQICSEGYFKQQNQCLQCDKSCKSCKGQRNTDCLTCHYKLYLHIIQEIYGACLQKCPKQFYFAQEETGTCEKCDPTCENCDGPSQDCKFCKVDYFKQGNKCVINECTKGFYKDIDYRNCVKCQISCLSCLGLGTKNCLSCQSGFYLTLMNSCEETCPEQFFPNKEKSKCEKCDSKCQLCLDQTDKNCQKCNQGFYLQNNECFEKCPIYFYPDKNGICQKCFENCETCIGEKSDQCSGCKNNFYLEENICVKKCVEFSYGESNKCFKCPKECKSCLASNYCTDCQQGFSKLNNKCVLKCLQQQYVENSVCKQCDIRCSNCFGPQINQCVACSQGFYLINHKCQESCPFSYFEDKSLLICQQCDGSCKTCTNIGKFSCLSCYNDQVLDSQGNCKNQCNNYEYLNGGICQKCSIECQSCFGPKDDQCIECNNNYCESSPHNCVKKCPGTYVCENRKCVQFCQAGFKLLSKNLCVKSCPIQLLEDKINKQCGESCPTGMFIVSKNDNKCDNCSNFNKVILNQYCEDKCNKGFYIDKLKTVNQYICNDCNAKCKDDHCLGPEVNQCLDCNSSQDLDQSLKCLQNCSNTVLIKQQCFSLNLNGYLLYLNTSQVQFSLIKLQLDTNLFPKIFLKQDQESQLKQFRKDEIIKNWDQQTCGSSQFVQDSKLSIDLLLTNLPQCEVFVELINNVKINVQFKGNKQKIQPRIINELQQNLIQKLNLQENQLLIQDISVLYQSKRILQEQELTLVQFIIKGSSIGNVDNDYNSIKHSEELQHKVNLFKDYLIKYEELETANIEYRIFVGQRPNSLSSIQTQGNFTEAQLKQELQIVQQQTKSGLKYFFVFGAIIMIIILLLLVIIFILNKIIKKQRQQEYEIKKVQIEIIEKQLEPKSQNDEDIEEEQQNNNETQNVLNLKNNNKQKSLQST